MNYLDKLNQLEFNSRIYIYGSGSFAITFLDQIQYYRNDIEIIGFIDKYKKEGFVRKIPLININRLKEIDHGKKIIVATDISFWNEISNDLEGYNYFINRFHDFNVYRRNEISYDTHSFKKIFTNTHTALTLLEAIENKNIKGLIDNPKIIQNQEELVKKLRLKPSSVIINGGGANGNENELFLKKIVNGKIFSFDPNHKEVSNIPQLHISPCVLYHKNMKVGFRENSSRSRIIESYNDNDLVVDATTLDTFVHKNNIRKVDLITLDVEGFEKKVLEGAEMCIKNHKPTLAISVYHSTADFFEIPIMLKKMCNQYSFEIGIYSQQGINTVLHASIGSSINS